MENVNGLEFLLFVIILTAAEAAIIYRLLLMIWPWVDERMERRRRRNGREKGDKGRDRKNRKNDGKRDEA